MGVHHLHLLALAFATAAPLCASAARHLLQVSAVEPSAPEGWWHALVVDGSYCRLAAYPPKAAAGTSRVACRSKKYDHNFIWRLTTRKSNLSLSSDVVPTNTGLHLRSFNLIATYTSVNAASKDLVAGVGLNKASLLTVEAYQAKGASFVSLQKDALRLAAKAGGYCARGGGSAAWLQCAKGARFGAGKVQLPYSSYWGVQLVNQLTRVPCAAQLPSGGRPGPVLCSGTQAEDAGGAWLSTFGLALQTPGAPRLVSGNASVALKAYDSIFHYKVYTWAVNASTPFNASFQAGGTSDAAQWLDLAKLSAVPGEEEIRPGDVVTIRSQATNQYCGVWSRQQPRLVCDLLSVGLLDVGYQFQITGAWLPSS